MRALACRSPISTVAGRDMTEGQKAHARLGLNGTTVWRRWEAVV